MNLSFDFEEEIQKQEAERQRLLESQGIGSRRDVSSGGAGAAGANESRTKHSIVCRHWLRNMCIKGDFCDFTHQYDYDKMPLCRQFHRYGYCADFDRGACLLKHESMTSRDTGPLCVHYFLGFCRAGPRCKKRHVRRPAQESPELLPDWYLQLLVSNREIIEPADSETEEKIRALEQLCRDMARPQPPQNPLNGDAEGFDDASTLRSTAGLDGLRRFSAAATEHRQGGSDELVSRGQQRNSLPEFGRGSTSDGGLLEANFSGQRGMARGATNDLLSGDGEAEGLLLYDRSGIVSGPDSTDFGITLPSPLPLEGRVRCFMIKSMRMENIYTSVQLGIWASGRMNTRKFEDAYRQNDHVLLFFSANESGGFQGIGRMSSLPDPNLHRGIWGNITARLGFNFRVQWLKQCSVDFEQLGHLTNPLNENHAIKKSRDGQELPFWLARAISRKLAALPDEDLLMGTSLESQPRMDHSTFFFNIPEMEQPPVPPGSTATAIIGAAVMTTPPPAPPPSVTFLPSHQNPPPLQLSFGSISQPAPPTPLQFHAMPLAAPMVQQLPPSDQHLFHHFATPPHVALPPSQPHLLSAGHHLHNVPQFFYNSDNTGT